MGRVGAIQSLESGIGQAGERCHPSWGSDALEIPWHCRCLLNCDRDRPHLVLLPSVQPDNFRAYPALAIFTCIKNSNAGHACTERWE